MNSEHDWIVESDISNFFPSVHVSDVSAHVQANSRLGIGLVRLLEYMLQTFSPMAAYHPSRVGGLPQEGFDVSRVLAHTYLGPLDDEFRTEGENDRYSRWVDDVVVGADTWDEALRVVQRIQGSLEGLGLYPNAAKTRIIPSAEFRSDYMKDANDWLGEFDDDVRAGIANIGLFETQLRRHVALSPRPKAWARVLRRFYTTARTLRSQTLVELWPDHVDVSPDSARAVFDYLSTFRLTGARFRRLLEVLDRFGTVYEDIEILAHEYVCATPCVRSPALRHEIGDWAMEVVKREIYSRPRIAAVAVMTLGKLGLDSHLDALNIEFGTWRQDTPARTQAAIVLLATNRLADSDILTLIGRSQLETIEALEFLQALRRGENQAVGMTLSALEPVQRHQPERYVTKPRFLFLAPLLKAADPTRYALASKFWRKKLRSNPPGLRDHVAEGWLKQT